MEGKYTPGIYAHGLPFSEIIGDNLNDLMIRIDNNKASCCIIDGLMGEGKTTFAVQCAEFIAKEKRGEIIRIKNKESYFYDSSDINFDKQLSMGGEQFQEKLQMCNDSKLKVVIYDEAGDFSKRGAISQFNQRLNRIFQTFRAFKILIIICLPSFNVLDNEIFNQGVPRILFNCHGRDRKQGNIRGYGLEEMFYLKYYMRQEVVPMKAYKKVSPNFRGHFLDLPPVRSQELNKISTEAKKGTLSTNILKNKGLVSYYDMAKRFGKAPYTIRLAIKKLNIKPTTKYKQMNYFEGEATYFLLDQHFNNSAK